MTAKLASLKARVREIGRVSNSVFDRGRRLYIHERPVALEGDDTSEYAIKREIAEYFLMPYSDVHFAGSTQLGFSAHKDREFIPRVSDCDVACVSMNLFQQAWIDVIETSRAFNNLPAFAPMKTREIEAFKEQIYKRGMIRIDAMPTSPTSTKWKHFESRLSRKHVSTFKSVSVAIYMNEYAFCRKQNSAIVEVVGE